MRAEAETSQSISSGVKETKSRLVIQSVRAWVSAHLTKNAAGSVRQFAICGAIFLTALGVRLLYWQDTAPEMSLHDTLSQNMAVQYRREARRILEEGTILVPRKPVERGDARLIIHPPGYSMVMAASFKLFGESEPPLRFLQILCDASAAVLVLLIGSELLPMGVAVLAGFLAALSPHAAYYSLRLSPDSLAVLPVLIAVYLTARAIKRPRLLTFAVAGAMLGLSCWLRANALFLAPLLAVVIAVLSERGKRMRWSLLLAAATLAVIAPITIRNWVVFHRFIPLALPFGVNLVQGIAELDKEGKFGMPLYDPDVQKKDVEWNERPDYIGHMWTPDGIERDRVRSQRGLSVIRSNPIWFSGAMLRRVAFMVSFNESRARDWPFNTATVPPVSATPPFGLAISNTNDREPVWSASPADLLSGGRTLTPFTEAALAPGGETLQIRGGGSEFENQFASAPIPVHSNTNYQLELFGHVSQGRSAVRVLGPNERVVLATSVLRAPEKADPAESSPPPIVFTSGDAEEVRLVVSNDGKTSEPPVVQLGKAALFEIGQTPTLWTRFPRTIIRGIERRLYKTERMLPLIIVGVALLAIGGRGRELLILLVVPVYFLVTHAPMSTEYRYILGIHYFLFVLAAATLYCLGAAVADVSKRVTRRFIQH